jgi:hypothetical protein
MDIQTNILFTVHEGAPFCRSMMLALITYSQGAPFYNAFSSASPVDAKPGPLTCYSGASLLAFSCGLLRCLFMQFLHPPIKCRHFV